MVPTPRRAAVVLAACLLLPPLTAASCTDEPSGIALGQAARGTVTEVVEASGAVTARAAGTVTSPAEGTLAALRTEPGGRVRKGQVVAVIDSPATEQRFAAAAEALDATSTGGGAVGGGAVDFDAVRVSTDSKAEQAFAAAREHAAEVTDPAVAKALTAQLDAAREQYLAASTAAAETVRSLQRGVASVGEAVAALGAAQRVQAQQAYDLAEAAVDALTLRAPVGGVVQLGGGGTAAAPALTDLLPTGAAALPTGDSGPVSGVSEALPVGAPVGVGTPILTVVDTSALGVTAEVDETDIMLVETGGAGTVELDAAPGVTWDATVRAVDLLPTTSARGGVSYRVHLALGAPHAAAPGPGADASAPPPGASAPAPGAGLPSPGDFSPDAGEPSSGPGGPSVDPGEPSSGPGGPSVDPGGPSTGPGPSPRPGMSAIVRLTVREAEGAVTVPASAVVSSDGRDTVWAVREGRAVRAPVTVGVRGEDIVQVADGLAPGDRIVIGGADQVRTGQDLP